MLSFTSPARRAQPRNIPAQFSTGRNRSASERQRNVNRWEPGYRVLTGGFTVRHRRLSSVLGAVEPAVRLDAALLTIALVCLLPVVMANFDFTVVYVAQSTFMAVFHTPQVMAAWTAAGYALGELPQHGTITAPAVFAPAAVGTVMITAFVWHALHQTQNPMIDLRLLRQRVVTPTTPTTHTVDTAVSSIRARVCMRFGVSCSSRIKAMFGDVISMTKSIRHCASPWSPTLACCGPPPISAT
jgi:hypothetical protein